MSAQIAAGLTFIGNTTQFFSAGVSRAASLVRKEGVELTCRAADIRERPHWVELRQSTIPRGSNNA
jgi:hypothetical protein